jgi:hypothetical protein
MDNQGRAAGFIVRALGGFVLIIGWALSPMTWWNDWVVNLPFAWFLASLSFRAGNKSFEFLFVFYYWLSNLLGLLMIYFGWRIFRLKNRITRKELIASFFISLVYSIMIILLIRFKLIAPMFRLNN